MSKAVAIQALLSGLVDTSGNPLSSGKVYTYDVGTTTPKSLYTDKAAATPAANPLILSANGTYPAFGYGAYKFVVKTSADVDVATYDNLYFTADVQSFVPSFSGSGAMTVALGTLYQAYYVQNGREVFFSISAVVTIGGVASTIVFYTLPVISNNGNTPFSASLTDSGVGGIANLNSSSDGALKRYDAGNWTAGANRYVFVSGRYLIP